VALGFHDARDGAATFLIAGRLPLKVALGLAPGARKRFWKLAHLL
jgi:hypothetical protein